MPFVQDCFGCLPSPDQLAESGGRLGITRVPIRVRRPGRSAVAAYEQAPPSVWVGGGNRRDVEPQQRQGLPQLSVFRARGVVRLWRGVWDGWGCVFTDGFYVGVQLRQQGNAEQVLVGRGR